MREIDQALFDAISQGRPERIGPLIAEGANSNAYHERLYDEWRPMHHAALDGRADCIRALLEAGVSPDAIDQYFSTPLHHAAGQGHPDCVALLLNAGADVNDRRSEFVVNIQP